MDADGARAICDPRPKMPVLRDKFPGELCQPWASREGQEFSKSTPPTLAELGLFLTAACWPSNIQRWAIKRHPHVAQCTQERALEAGPLEGKWGTAPPTAVRPQPAPRPACLLCYNQSGVSACHWFHFLYCKGLEEMILQVP